VTAKYLGYLFGGVTASAPCTSWCTFCGGEESRGAETALPSTANSSKDNPPVVPPGRQPGRHRPCIRWATYPWIPPGYVPSRLPFPGVRTLAPVNQAVVWSFMYKPQVSPEGPICRHSCGRHFSSADTTAAAAAHHTPGDTKSASNHTS